MLPYDVFSVMRSVLSVYYPEDEVFLIVIRFNMNLIAVSIIAYINRSRICGFSTSHSYLPNDVQFGNINVFCDPCLQKK